MDAGRSRASIRRSVQALSGFVIRQRPRVGSRADLGSTKFNNIANTTSPFFTGTTVAGKINYNASIFKAGVNYKF
jgi:hypothetical protein